MVKVIQLNCGKSSSATDDLRGRVDRKEIDVMLLQEPSGKKNGIQNIYGGKMYFKSKLKVRARAAVWLSRAYTSNCVCIQLEQYSNRDMVAVEVAKRESTGIKKMVICSIYMPSLDRDNKRINDPVTIELKNLIGHCVDNRIELVIGSDSNAHNEIWGDKNNDARGDKIVELIDRSELKLLNNGSYPTFIPASTNIDITIASKGIEEKISNWKVEPGDSMSDHRAITFTIELERITPERERFKKRTDWIRYKRIMKKELEKRFARIEINNTEELDYWANELQKQIIDTYNLCCKEVEMSVKCHMKWYNNELKEERAKLRKEYTKMTQARLRSPERSLRAQFKYKENRLSYTKKCRKAKKLNWQDNMNKLEKTKDIARLQKLLESEKPPEIGTLLKDDNSYTNGQEEVVEELMKTHFPDCQRLEENLIRNYAIYTSTEEEKAEIEEAVSDTRISWAIDELGSFKSPGEDGIFPALIQKVKEDLVPILKVLYRHSLRMGYIPESWRGTMVTFLPKVGKGTYDRAKSYRPISLMSFILKILEKLIDKKIREGEVENKIHKNQHAYRKKKGTDTALHSLISHIERNMHNDEIAIATFIDIEGAFDNTNFEVMKTATEQIGVKKWMVNWIDAMLKNRNIKATMKGSDIRYNPTRGCPQGGCLSPLLWSIVVDSLIKKLSGAGFKVVAYADDLAIICSGKSKLQNSLCERMREGMKIVERWCRRNGLNVNPEKSQVMRFSKGNMTKPLNEVKLFDKAIKREKVIKYLGVWIDEKLTWRTHIENLIKKANNSLWATKSMVSKSWGINPKMTLWIYQQIIIPRITYGCMVWWHKAQSKTNQIKLASMQRKALMMVTGAVSNTPTEALNAILSVTPIQIKIKMNAMKACSRLRNNKMWEMRNYYTKQHRGIVLEVEKIETAEDRDEIDPIWNTNKKYKCIINERKNWKYSLPISKNSECWYSDGSKIENKTAYGAYNPEKNKSIGTRISDHATVMQAELLGIKACADTTTEAGTTRRDLLILTDSQAAIRALDNNLIRSKTVLLCANALNSVCDSGNRVKLAWVPGHSSIKGNEEADKIAKLATEKATVDEVTTLATAKNSDKIDTLERVESINHWNMVKSGFIHSNIMIKGYEDAKSKILLNGTRKDIRVITGFLTGCCCLYGFLEKIGKVNDNRCRYCFQHRENMNHIMNECVIAECKRHLLRIDELDDNLQDIRYRDIIAYMRGLGLYNNFFREEALD
jgi:ribonuclease HI